MKPLFISIILFLALPCGAQWQFVAGNLGTSGTESAFGVHDTSLFASGDGSIGRYLSPQHWAKADSGINFSLGSSGEVTSFASLGRYFFGGIGNGPVYISTNNGTSWFHGTTASPIASNGTYLFSNYVGPNQIILSTDSGSTWDTVFDIPVNSFAAKGAFIFASNGDGVWRSTDSGWHWARDTMPITTANSFVFVGMLTFGTNGSIIIKSTDFGSHWTEITIQNRRISQLASTGSYLFAGTDSGVFVSLDSGSHWREVSEGLVSKGNLPYVTAMIVFDTQLFVSIDASDGYGYDAARPISQMVDTGPASVVQTSIPGDTIEIYPNPTLSQISIRSVNTSILGVQVLNVLGVVVLDVPNEHASNLTLDLSKLLSGTYFLQIQTADGLVLRKVVRE